MYKNLTLGRCGEKFLNDRSNPRYSFLDVIFVKISFKILNIKYLNFKGGLGLTGGVKITASNSSCRFLLTLAGVKVGLTARNMFRLITAHPHIHLIYFLQKKININI